MPLVNVWIRDEDYSTYLLVKAQGRTAWPDLVRHALNSASTSAGTAVPTVVPPAPKPKKEEEDSNVDHRNNTRDNTNPTTTSGVLRTPEQKQKLDSYFRRPKQEEEWSGPITKADSARKRK